MKFVITGASGHIGNNLVRMIGEKYPDSEIVALTRRKIDCECTQIIGDLFSEEFLSQNIDSETIFVHCAGFIDLSDKKCEETFRVNVGLTQKVLNASLKKSVKKFIFIGTTDAIVRNGEEVIAEPDDYFPDKIEGNYGKSKAEASRVVLDAIKNNPEFNAAIVIPSAVIGINDYKPSAIGKIICGIINGRAEIGIRGGYNFVDVEDVCRVILSLSLNDKRGQYIVSGEAVEVKTLFERINSLLGIKRSIIILPTLLVKLLLPFIPQLNKITLKALRETHNFSCDRARRELGFIPTPFDITLENTIEWFKNER